MNSDRPPLPFVNFFLTKFRLFLNDSFPKPNALFVVFLGMKCAYDFVKKKLVKNSWVYLALKFWPFQGGKQHQMSQILRIGLEPTQKS